VCVELTKVLVHLGDEFAVEGFHDYRSTAMVAIVTNCPDQVAQYLTSQVYSENYSLRHRMDMLEVLTLSATELSSVVPPVPTQVEKAEITETTRRMEGKTKRFPSAKRIDGQPNRLAPVAGYFFFPLVNGFSK
jgi:telomere length regulation protein